MTGQGRVPQRMFRNTTAYMAAGLIPNIINLFILPLYARHVAPHEYGLVALVVTFTLFVGAVMGLQLTNSIHRLFFDYEEDERKLYCTTVLISVLLINLAILVPLHLAGPWIAERVFPRVDLPYRPLLMLGLGLMFCQSLINYGNSMLRVQERGGALLIASLAHTAASVALGVYLVVLRGMGAEGLLIAMAGSAAVHVVMHAWMVRSQLRLSFSLPMFRRAAAYSIPIIPHSLGGLLFTYSDKYVASYFVPMAMIGLYEFGDRIALVFKLLVQSFYHAISPTFMRDSLMDREDTLDRFKGIITRWSACYAFVYLGMALLLKEVVILIFPPNYHGCYVFIPILMAAYLFRGLYGFAIDTILFEKKTYLIPVITFSAGAFNVGANIVLLPRFGMIAAAWTTLASFGLTFLMALHYSRRIYPLRIDWRALIGIFLPMLAALLVGLRVDTGTLWVDASIKCGLIGLYALYLGIKDFGGMKTWLANTRATRRAAGR